MTKKNKKPAPRAPPRPKVVETILRMALVDAVRRKSFAALDAEREPPSLVSLMDRTAFMLLKPEQCSTLYLEFIKEDLDEARACLEAVSFAVANAPKLRKPPRSVSKKKATK